jgi:branched-chain amino acid transport system ATP-binding protein
MKVLEVETVTAGYDPEIDVLRDVSLHVGERESVSLMGANGAGKSTLLKLISALLHPRKGSIRYEGQDIDHIEPHEVVRRGIIQIPEERATFDNMTVQENLTVACQTKRSEQKREKNLAFVFETFPVLRGRRDQMASTLSGGEQKMLAVGKSIMQEPKMLLLDDISMGLAPKIVEILYSRLKELKDSLEIPVLLVEQNVEIALSFTERGYLISGGEIILTGQSEKLKEAEEVRKSYIGV